MSATLINTPRKVRRNRPMQEEVKPKTPKPKAKVSLIEAIKGQMLYVVVILAAAGLLAASSLYQSELICDDIAVQMTSPEGKQLLDVDDIKETLGITTGANILGQPLGGLDFKHMESQLRAHPSVASVQVFHRLNGVLYVDLTARTPIARVSGVDEDFYLDISGRKFPLSPHYSPNVPLVRGVLDENMAPTDTLGCVLEEMMPVIRYVHEDPFWSAQVSEIRRTQAGEIILYPEVGSIPMVLGDTENLENKFERLFAFYEQVVRKHGWEKYRQISVKYKGQVIAKKN